MRLAYLGASRRWRKEAQGPGWWMLSPACSKGHLSVRGLHTRLHLSTISLPSHLRTPQRVNYILDLCHWIDIWAEIR